MYDEKRQELKDELSHAMKSADDIIEKAKTEKRSLDDAEQRSFDDLEKKAESLRKEIEQVDQTLDRIRRQAEMADSTKEVRKARQPISAVARTDRPADDLFAFDRQLFGCGELRAFTRNAFGANHRALAYKSGKWWLATALGHESSKRWCQQHGVEFRALSSDVNTAGGVLVPDELQAAIITLREEYGFIRREAQLIPMGRDVMEVPRRTGNMTATPTGQGASLTESDGTLDQVSLTTRKWGILTRFSTELDEDAVVNIGDMVAQEMAYAFAYAEDDAAVNGDGTSTYNGVYGLKKRFDNNLTLTGAVGVTTATHNLFTEIDIDDLIGLMAACPAYARRNAKWLCSQPFVDAVFVAIMAAGGGQIFTTMQDGMTQMRFLGFPIIVSQVMPAGIATDYNNICVCLFGDFRAGCMFGDRRGITVGRSADRYFDTDQIGIRATERWDFNFHGYGSTSAAGPVVGLIGSSS